MATQHNTTQANYKENPNRIKLEIFYTDSIKINLNPPQLN